MAHPGGSKIKHARGSLFLRATMKSAMKKLTLQFTEEEIGVLTSMASDQLFRKQFIDPKMPGFRPNAEELAMCKEVVERLRTLSGTNRPKTEVPLKRRAAGR